VGSDEINAKYQCLQFSLFYEKKIAVKSLFDYTIYYLICIYDYCSLRMIIISIYLQRGIITNISGY